MKSLTKLISQLNEKYEGYGFDFSKSEYNGTGKPFTFICSKHGEVTSTVDQLLRKRSRHCIECGKESFRKKRALTQEQFLSKVKGFFPEYDFSKAVYVSHEIPVEVGLPTGEYVMVLPTGLLVGKRIRKDAVESGLVGLKPKTTQEFVNECIERFGDRFLYDKTVYGKESDPVIITCKVHGDFESTPRSILKSKYSCPGCVKDLSEIDRLGNEDLKISLEKNYPGVYNYLGFFRDRRLYLSIQCKKCGLTKNVLHSNILKKHADCANCTYHGSSKQEHSLRDFIESLGIKVENRYKVNGVEIDIFCPYMNLGIEYHGLYWHSEKVGKDSEYHLRKLNLTKQAGVTLIQVFEDEWVYKSEIVKERLKSIFGYSSRQFARKTKVVELNSSATNTILNLAHIQGSGSPPSIRLGLENKNKEIIAVMTFGKLRFENQAENHFELLRFVSVGTVVGGFSKLLSYFIKTFKPTSITSYSDKRWSVGNVYERNGFSYVGSSSPGYFWCKGNKRFNRMNFQKHKLKNILEKFDPNKTESENCEENGYFKIYDCGMDKWVINF